MQQPKHYAVIDTAVLGETFFELLEQENPPCTCLYSGDLDAALEQVAPYLIQVTPGAKAWLEKKQNQPWGIYVVSTENLVTVRIHLKKYLQVKLPTEEKTVFLRFYDPRVIWDFLAILDDWTLHQFMGPITTIQTDYLEQREETFATIRSQFPHDSKQYRTLLTLTTEQFALLQQQELSKFKQHLESTMLITYQQQRSEQMNYSLRHFGVEPVLKYDNQTVVEMIKQLVDDFTDFCIQHDIDEDAAQQLAVLLINHEIYHLHDIPERWLKRLTNNQYPIHYNMQVLTTQIEKQQEVI